MRIPSLSTDPVFSKPCTVENLAEYLGATPRFVRNEIAAGRLRARRLSARLIRILPADLQQWLREVQRSRLMTKSEQICETVRKTSNREKGMERYIER